MVVHVVYEGWCFNTAIGSYILVVIHGYWWL